MTVTFQNINHSIIILVYPVSTVRFPRLIISGFQVSIWLKYRERDVNPQNNQPRQPTNEPTSLSRRQFVVPHKTDNIIHIIGQYKKHVRLKQALTQIFQR